MKLTKKHILVNLLVAVIIFLPLLSLAQTTIPPAVVDTVKIKNPISVNNINDFIKKLLEAVLKIGIPLVALAIIYSGFLFVFARGNSEKLKTAKNALLYSVIGAVILLGSWAIATLIAETVKEL